MTFHPMDIALYRGRGALVMAVDGSHALLAMAHLQPQRVPVARALRAALKRPLRNPPPGPPARREEAVAELESYVRSVKR